MVLKSRPRSPPQRRRKRGPSVLVPEGATMWVRGNDLLHAPQQTISGFQEDKVFGLLEQLSTLSVMNAQAKEKER